MVEHPRQQFSSLSDWAPSSLSLAGKLVSQEKIRLLRTTLFVIILYLVVTYDGCQLFQQLDVIRALTLPITSLVLRVM
jgi:hypothetical protein